MEVIGSSWIKFVGERSGVEIGWEETIVARCNRIKHVIANLNEVAYLARILNFDRPMFQGPAAWGDSEIRWLMLAFWRLR